MVPMEWLSVELILVEYETGDNRLLWMQLLTQRQGWFKVYSNVCRFGQSVLGYNVLIAM